MKRRMVPESPFPHVTRQKLDTRVPGRPCDNMTSTVLFQVFRAPLGGILGLPEASSALAGTSSRGLLGLVR